MRNSNCFSTSALKLQGYWYFQLLSSNDDYYLSQSKYVYELISCIDFIGYKFANTPLGTNERRHSLDGKPFHDASLYWAQQINVLPSKKQYAMVEQQLVSSLTSSTSTYLFLWLDCLFFLIVARSLLVCFAHVSPTSNLH